MADYLQLIETQKLVAFSEKFDYLYATRNFVGLRFFPLVRTENMKLAVAQLMEYGEVPVIALVHALDSEAKIGDRPNAEGFEYQLLYIKEKINAGEALRKYVENGVISAEKQAIINKIYDDAANMISRVLTRIEAMACEVISDAKLTIKENNVDILIDYHLPVTHRQTVTGWATISHDILGDLAKIQKAAKNKIVRAVTTSKVMGYITANTAISTLAAAIGEINSLIWVKSFILTKLGIEFVVYDGTYRLSAQEEAEYYFLDENVITFLTTRETLGNTFITSTPPEDYGIIDRLEEGFVAVTQDFTKDPVTLWTIAGAIALPCPVDIRQMYICTVVA